MENSTCSGICRGWVLLEGSRGRAQGKWQEAQLKSGRTSDIAAVPQNLCPPPPGRPAHAAHLSDLSLYVPLLCLWLCLTALVCCLSFCVAFSFLRLRLASLCLPAPLCLRTLLSRSLCFPCLWFRIDPRISHVSPKLSVLTVSLFPLVCLPNSGQRESRRCR